jgi:hypothetical protein
VKSKIRNLLFDSNKGKIKLNDKASIFFFCLLLSTFFWFLSALSKTYTTDLSIPLSYDSFAKDFMLTEEPIKALRIEVSGSGFELLGEQMSLDRKEILVDLSTARKINANAYGISAQRLKEAVLEQLDKDLRLNGILTDSITFKTQKKVSKKLKVVPNLELTYKGGFKLRGEISVVPDSVMVLGPEEQLSNLKSIETELLSKKDLEDSSDFSLGLKLPVSMENIQLTKSRVTVKVPIEKFTEKVFELKISVKSTNTENLIRTFPTKVKVSILVPLSKYEFLNESILQAKVDFSKNSIERKKLTVEITGVPEYCELIRLEPERVEFIVKK